MTDHANAVRELMARGRAIESESLAGMVKVITTEQVEALLAQFGGAAGGVDAMRLHTLEARLAEAESRADIAEAEARRRNEQIAQLEGQLGGVHVGEETHVTIGDPAEARGFVDLLETPDYPGTLAEIAEAREDLGRLSERLGGPGGEVRELATAIMKALGGDEDEDAEAAAEPAADGPPENPGITAVRGRLDAIEGTLQRDRDATGILVDAMLDGQGTVSVVVELLTMSTRDLGFAQEVRTLRSCLALLAELPIGEP